MDMTDVEARAGEVGLITVGLCVLKTCDFVFFRDILFLQFRWCLCSSKVVLVLDVVLSRKS
jgi:hypothetical protein